MTDPGHKAALRAMLGARGWTDDPAVMAPWLTDWRGTHSGAAFALASPASTQEVANVVRYCAAQRIAIVPQGGNSGMVAGATPDATGDSLLLSLRRMAAIGTGRIASGLVEVEAGVILQNLHEAMMDHGWRFPLTLGGKGSATVGGLVSTNAGGTQVLRHGTMRALVAGVEAVLPDGRIFTDMAALAKDNRGYAIRDLFVGAEGTLGIVTRTVLRLAPVILDRSVAWVGLDSLDDARTLLLECQRGSGQQLEGFEVLPHDALDHVVAHIDGTRSPLANPHRWYALVEFVRDLDALPPSEQLAHRILAEAVNSGLARDVAMAASEKQAEAMWRIRDSISEAERACGPAVQHDVSVPVDRMTEFVDEATARIERNFAGTSCMAFGHLGDGNVHFHVRAPDRLAESEWSELNPEISALVYDIVDQYRGSIAAEHGIGRSKHDLLPTHIDAVRLDLMRAIKRTIDPDGLMNPGALVDP